MTFLGSIKKYLKIAFIPLALAHIIVLENIRFTLWPEMVVYPYLLNNGFVLYKDLINPYPPLLTVVLSIFSKIFSYEPQMFQILTWLIIFTTDIVIYQATLKLTKNDKLSLISLLFFVVFSIPLGINNLWFDLVQAPIIVMSAYLFAMFVKTHNLKRLNMSLFLIFVAYFIKQQAIWLLLLYLTILLTLYGKKSLSILKHLLPSLTFFLGVNALLAIYFYYSGTLANYLYWTIYFPYIVASVMPGYVSLPSAKQLIPVVLIFILCLPSLQKPKSHSHLIFAIASVCLIFAYPRFDYFHLIPSLALLSILAGQSYKQVLSSNRLIKSTLLIAFVLLSVYTSRYIYRNYTTEIRFFEPKIESQAGFIKLSTSPDNLIYIQNGPDQVLPLAHRLPPKPWADEFPWYLEKNDLQDKIVKSMDRENPAFILFKPYETGEKFALGVYRPTIIADYLDTNYVPYFKLSDELWLKKKI